MPRYLTVHRVSHLRWPDYCLEQEPCCLLSGSLSPFAVAVHLVRV